MASTNRLIAALSMTIRSSTTSPAWALHSAGVIRDGCANWSTLSTCRTTGRQLTVCPLRRCASHWLIKPEWVSGLLLWERACSRCGRHVWQANRIAAIAGKPAPTGLRRPQGTTANRFSRQTLGRLTGGRSFQADSRDSSGSAPGGHAPWHPQAPARKTCDARFPPTVLAS